MGPLGAFLFILVMLIPIGIGVVSAVMAYHTPPRRPIASEPAAAPPPASKRLTQGPGFEPDGWVTDLKPYPYLDERPSTKGT